MHILAQLQLFYMHSRILWEQFLYSLRVFHLFRAKPDLAEKLATRSFVQSLCLKFAILRNVEVVHFISEYNCCSDPFAFRNTAIPHFASQ